MQKGGTETGQKRDVSSLRRDTFLSLVPGQDRDKKRKNSKIKILYINKLKTKNQTRKLSLSPQK